MASRGGHWTKGGFVRGGGALARSPDDVSASFGGTGNAAAIANWEGNIIVNRDIYARLGEEDRVALLAHELAHHTIEQWATKPERIGRYGPEFIAGEYQSGALKGLPFYAGGSPSVTEAIPEVTTHILAKAQATSWITDRHMAAVHRISRDAGISLANIERVARQRAADLTLAL